MNDTFDACIVMLVLFNPFLMTAYLHGLMKELSVSVFVTVLVRAFIISGLVFCAFAWAGDYFFSNILQVRFAAFLIFGGIVFLLIALRSMVAGAALIDALRGSPEHLAGSLAMPFMIGPGTVSASVLIGSRLPFLYACLAITCALALSCLFLVFIKSMFDYVQKRSESLLNRYVEIIGRVSAIIIGTIAVDMIMKGVDLWLKGATP